MQLISEHAKNLSKLLFWSIFVFKNFKVYPYIYIYTHKQTHTDTHTQVIPGRIHKEEV